jgi:hypothetical protein
MLTRLIIEYSMTIHAVTTRYKEIDMYSTPYCTQYRKFMHCKVCVSETSCA